MVARMEKDNCGSKRGGEVGLKMVMMGILWLFSWKRSAFVPGGSGFLVTSIDENISLYNTR
jgi:hypothetical protein